MISYLTKLTVLRVAYNGKIQHLADMDLDDEIIIYTSVLAGHTHRLVLVATHNSIWFFNLENVENIDVDSKLILPEVIFFSTLKNC